FVGIPGSVGGAVRMNAGGHGAETTDVVRTARVVELDEGRPRELTRAALGLGYRHSALGPRAVVLAASFAGRSDAPEECGRRIVEDATSVRLEPELRLVGFAHSDEEVGR